MRPSWLTPAVPRSGSGLLTGRIRSIVGRMSPTPTSSLTRRPSATSAQPASVTTLQPTWCGHSVTTTRPHRRRWDSRSVPSVRTPTNLTKVRALRYSLCLHRLKRPPFDIFSHSWPRRAMPVIAGKLSYHSMSTGTRRSTGPRAALILAAVTGERPNVPAVASRANAARGRSAHLAHGLRAVGRDPEPHLARTRSVGQDAHPRRPHDRPRERPAAGPP